MCFLHIFNQKVHICGTKNIGGKSSCAGRTAFDFVYLAAIGRTAGVLVLVLVDGGGKKILGVKCFCISIKCDFSPHAFSASEKCRNQLGTWI